MIREGVEVVSSEDRRLEKSPCAITCTSAHRGASDCEKWMVMVSYS